MNFEVKYALKLLGQGAGQYFVEEALADPDITMKRYAVEILFELEPTEATRTLIAKIRLY